MAKPLLNIHGETEDFCDYPTVLKIPMDDGTIQTYALENKSKYQFENVMKCVRRSKIGYQYGGSFGKRKNRNHGGKP